ncbi:PDZ and LIM domain protein 7 isoform X1 [Tachysurus ichikawai]
MGTRGFTRILYPGNVQVKRVIENSTPYGNMLMLCQIPADSRSSSSFAEVTSPTLFTSRITFVELCGTCGHQCLASIHLTPGGKAAQAGVGVGDSVVSIEDSNAEEMTHVEAQNKIRAAVDSLTLTLNRKAAICRIPANVLFRFISSFTSGVFMAFWSTEMSSLCIVVPSCFLQPCSAQITPSMLQDS